MRVLTRILILSLVFSLFGCAARRSESLYDIWWEEAWDGPFSLLKTDMCPINVVKDREGNYSIKEIGSNYVMFTNNDSLLYVPMSQLCLELEK